MKSHTKILIINFLLLLMLLLSAACQPIRPANPKHQPMNKKIGGELTASQDLAVGLGIPPFQVSPDSRYAVYLVMDEDKVGTFTLTLWSAPLSREHPPVQLAKPAKLSWMNNFAITTDGKRVLYDTVNFPTNSAEQCLCRQVYSTPIAGGEVVHFNQMLLADLEITSYQISHQNDFVILLTQQSGAQNSLAIYKTPIQGGEATVLISDFPTDTIQIGNAIFSQDDTWLVYTLGTRDGKVQLYSLSTKGGRPIRLNPPLVTGGSVELIYGVPETNFQVNSDSRYIVYRADQETDSVYELFSVPIGGGQAIKLNAPLVKDGDVATFAISPNGAQVVYRADQDIDAMYELYSVSITGGTPRKLNPPLVPGGNVLDTIAPLGPESGYARGTDHFSITPDSQSVVYIADQTVDEHLALYSVPIMGGAAVRLSPEADANRHEYLFYQVTSDGQLVTFILNDKLYQSSISGVPAASAISTAAALYPRIVSPNGQWALYYEYQTGGEYASAIYAVPLNGDTPLKLSETMTSGGGIGQVLIPPDSNSVIYRADQETDEVWELFVTAPLFDE